MRKKSIAFIFVVVCTVGLQAQNITAFYDSNGAFNIFDNGLIVYKEYEKPISFKVGGNCVAFIDNETIFKIYYKGEILKPYGDNLIDGYTVTHNLVLFSIHQKLLVFDNGKTTVLVNNPGHTIAFSDNGAYNYQVSDSLLVFQDIDTKSLQVYCNGKIDTIATAPSMYPQLYPITRSIKYGRAQGYVYHYTLGKNTLAFIDKSNFKVYYNNHLYNLFSFPVPDSNYTKVTNQYNSFSCAGNIVGFINPLTKKLCAFYKGQTYVMPTVYLCGYTVGDDMLTYTDSASVHVFYDAKIYDIPDLNANFIRRPTNGYYESKYVEASYTYNAKYATNNFIIKDGIMLFYVNGRNKIFCQGAIYELGDISNQQFQIDNNTIAWIDHQNNLNTLYNGKPFTLSTLIMPSSYTVCGNTVWFNTTANQDQVFFKGKTY